MIPQQDYLKLYRNVENKKSYNILEKNNEKK